MTKEHLSSNPKRLKKDSFNLKIDEFLLLNEKGTLDFNAPYQRGLVWTQEQKEELISSITEWIPINALYWNEYNEVRPYEVIDGKQRLSTIIDYCSDKFKWKGYYYSELPQSYRSIIKSFSVVVYQTSYETTEECEKLFNRINFTGTLHEKQIKNI